MAKRLYDKTEWHAVREEVISRDGQCVLNWLGPCSDDLHVHHTSYDDPYNPQKLVLVCQAHHGSADHLRRFSAKWKRCSHHHPTREGREQCERRLNAV